MKRSCLYASLMLVAFIFALSAGSLIYVDKALAVAGNCESVTATNYKKCKDCQCKVFDVFPGDIITSQTVQAIQNCTSNWRCYTQPVKYSQYDLNGDGKIDWKDTKIAQKCLGCEATPPSVFK